LTNLLDAGSRAAAARRREGEAGRRDREHGCL